VVVVIIPLVIILCTNYISEEKNNKELFIKMYYEIKAKKTCLNNFIEKNKNAYFNSVKTNQSMWGVSEILEGECLQTNTIESIMNDDSFKKIINNNDFYIDITSFYSLLIGVNETISEINTKLARENNDYIKYKDNNYKEIQRILFENKSKNLNISITKAIEQTERILFQLKKSEYLKREN